MMKAHAMWESSGEIMLQHYLWLGGDWWSPSLNEIPSIVFLCIGFPLGDLVCIGYWNFVGIHLKFNTSLPPFPNIPPCPSFLLSLPPSLSFPLTPALYPTSPLSPSLPLLILAHLFLDNESSRYVRELEGDNVVALSMVGRWLMITMVKRAPFNCVLVHRFSSWRSWMYWLLELCWYTHKIQHLSLSLPHYPSM